MPRVIAEVTVIELAKPGLDLLINKVGNLVEIKWIPHGSATIEVTRV